MPQANSTHKVLFIIILLLYASCEKEKLPELQISAYETFLQEITSSDRYLVVPHRDLDKTNAPDKVIISIRHDMDNEFLDSKRMAMLEYKYNVVGSYYVLHTANYYGKTDLNFFSRNTPIASELLEIQDFYKHEVGLHNDLVTLQIVYNLNSVDFLKQELNYLRKNGLKMEGSTAHGSDFCYKYFYTNHYFWEGYTATPDDFFKNWQTVPINNKLVTIQKAKSKDFFEYDGNLVKHDYFYADCFFENGKRWSVDMLNLDSIPIGKKVIILLHPQYWY